MKIFPFLFSIVYLACSSEDTKIAKNSKISGTSTLDQNRPDLNSNKTSADFEANLLPVINSNCSSCHKTDGSGSGPASIYKATTLEALAKKGTSSSESDLIKKLRNQISHGGGNVCPKGSAELPCSAFVSWSNTFYASSIPSSPSGVLPKDMINPGSPPSSSEYGYIRSTDLTGQLDGFAYNKSNPALQVPIEVYTAPYATGSLPLLSSTANSTGSAGGVAGDHRFALNIASSLPASGKVTIYIYAVIGGSRKSLGDSPKTFTVYKKNPDGRAYFDSTAKPIFTSSCERSGCHGPRAYEEMYLNLLNPAPDGGGTATNNLLYRKASGGSHSGGNVCASNGQVCPTIVSWFQKELP
ncbi:MAG: hypothetical protein WCI18_13745 [Pseudomonadota bacterium]